MEDGLGFQHEVKVEMKKSSMAQIERTNSCACSNLWDMRNMQ